MRHSYLVRPTDRGCITYMGPPRTGYSKSQPACPGLYIMHAVPMEAYGSGSTQRGSSSGASVATIGHLKFSVALAMNKKSCEAFVTSHVPLLRWLGTREESRRSQMWMNGWVDVDARVMSKIVVLCLGSSPPKPRYAGAASNCSTCALQYSPSLRSAMRRCRRFLGKLLVDFAGRCSKFRDELLGLEFSSQSSRPPPGEFYEDPCGLPLMAFWGLLQL